MELLTRYLYNSGKYDSEWSLRQAVYENARVAFGDLTDELKSSLGITEEQYNPDDELTDEEIASRVRYQRDSMLSATDFYLMPDYTAATEEGLVEVKAYRQALRDITEQEGFPRNVEWPSLPSVLSGMSLSRGRY